MFAVLKVYQISQSCHRKKGTQNFSSDGLNCILGVVFEWCWSKNSRHNSIYESKSESIGRSTWLSNRLPLNRTRSCRTISRSKVRGLSLVDQLYRLPTSSHRFSPFLPLERPTSFLQSVLLNKYHHFSDSCDIVRFRCSTTLLTEYKDAKVSFHLFINWIVPYNWFIWADSILNTEKDDSTKCYSISWHYWWLFGIIRCLWKVSSFFRTDNRVIRRGKIAISLEIASCLRQTGTKAWEL